jgi:NAD(P)-dependent dehydrogenase (short-subunit alcohol dehydrogenase family)
VTLRAKAAIVTGASGSIGSVTVRAFAQRGAHVVLAAPESELLRLEELAGEARELGARALVVPTDVTLRADVDRLVARTVEEFGTVDVLAYIAGVGSSPSLCDCTDEEIERVLNVNLLGCARVIHAVLPIMKAKRSGSIVTIGSIAGEAGVMGVYSASKFGVRGLTDSVRREVMSYKIGVTLIEPGFVRSQMNALMESLPSPQIVADAIVRAALRPRRRVIVPKRYRIPVFVFGKIHWFTDLVFGNARIQERLNHDSRTAKQRLAEGQHHE